MRSLAPAVGLAFGVVLSGGLLDASMAGCGTYCGSDDGDDSGSVSTDGQSVTVSVTGTLVQGGSPGSPGSSGSTTVRVEPPCSYFQGSSGKEWYDFWYPNGGDKPITITNPDHEVSHPPPEVKKHKNDTEGHWWHPSCSSGNFDGSFDDWVDHAEDYFDDHDSVFVEQGEVPPIPPIPPELLLQAAEEALTVPDPEFDWNPKRTEDQGTLVNLPTWFWLDQDLPTQGSVTASVDTMAGRNSVTVEMGLVSVAFSGGEAGSITCPDGGVPWRPGASSDCTLSFPRAGEHAVSADTRWEGSWSFNGTPRGAVDPVGASWGADLAVSEVQSLVTGID